MGTIKIDIQNTFTNPNYVLSYKGDTNYDGVYDDQDFMAKGYNVYCLTSLFLK